MARARSDVMPLIAHSSRGCSRMTSKRRSPNRSTASAARKRTKGTGVRSQGRKRATSVDPIHQLSGPDLDLPAVLVILGPGPSDAHIGAKRDRGRQIPYRADARALRLLEWEKWQSMLVAEVHGRERAANVGLGAGDGRLCCPHRYRA